MGNVAIGDEIEKTNFDLLRLCCSINGEIIRPDTPLSLTNQDFHSISSFGTNSGNKNEIVMTSYSSVSISESDIGTRIGHLHQNIIITHKTSIDVMLPVSELTGNPDIMYSTKANQCNIISSESFSLPKSENFQKFVTTESFLINGKQIGFLGDLSKASPISRNRFETIQIENGQIIIFVKNSRVESNEAKLDTIEIGFCVGDKLVSNSFMFGGDENTVTVINFDVESESIICDTCKGCSSCACPSGCGDACKVGIECSPTYKECSKSDDEFCQSSAQCPSGYVFSTKFDECGECITLRDCDGCPSNSDGECDCNCVESPLLCYIPPTDECSAEYEKCELGCKYSQICPSNEFVDIDDFDECPAGDLCKPIDECGETECSGEACQCQGNASSCKIGDICDEYYQMCKDNCLDSFGTYCPNDSKLIPGKDGNLECSNYHDCDNSTPTTTLTTTTTAVTITTTSTTTEKTTTTAERTTTSTTELPVTTTTDSIVTTTSIKTTTKETESTSTATSATQTTSSITNPPSECEPCHCPQQCSFCKIGKICQKGLVTCQNGCYLDDYIYCPVWSKNITSNDECNQNFICDYFSDCDSYEECPECDNRICSI